MKNEKLIHEFKKLVAYIKYKTKDLDKHDKEYIKYRYKLQRYYYFIGILKKSKTITLTNYKKLQDIEGVGEKTILRVKEILKTGRLHEIPKDFSYKESDTELLDELASVVGIGEKMAKELIKNGIKSVADLKKKVKKNKIDVNNKIKLGLRYHGIFKRNIPRKEMDKINDLVKKATEKLNHNLQLRGHEKLIVKLCGSYRRKKETSNDIDILLTKCGDEGSRNYLEEFVKLLKMKLHFNDNKRFIIDDITDDVSRTKYMGFSKYKDKPVRRIDIRLVKEAHYPFALLYFTGSKEFNQRMRKLAKSKGYKLSEYGLFDKYNKSIKVKTEEGIFDFLGMRYVKPENRI